jgi:hypothetical protein
MNQFHPLDRLAHEARGRLIRDLATRRLANSGIFESFEMRGFVRPGAHAASSRAQLVNNEEWRVADEAEQDREQGHLSDVKRPWRHVIE